MRYAQIGRPWTERPMSTRCRAAVSALWAAVLGRVATEVAVRTASAELEALANATGDAIDAHTLTAMAAVRHRVTQPL